MKDLINFMSYLVFTQLILFGQSSAEGTVDVVGRRQSENSSSTYKSILMRHNIFTHS